MSTKHPLMARMEIASEIAEWVADQGREGELRTIAVHGTDGDVDVFVTASLLEDLRSEFIDDGVLLPTKPEECRTAYGYVAGVYVIVSESAWNPVRVQ